MGISKDRLVKLIEKSRKKKERKIQRREERKEKAKTDGKTEGKPVDKKQAKKQKAVKKAVAEQTGLNSINKSQFEKTSEKDAIFFKDMNEFEDYLENPENFQINNSKDALAFGKSRGKSQWKKLDISEFIDAEGVSSIEILENPDDLPKIIHANGSSVSKDEEKKEKKDQNKKQKPEKKNKKSEDLGVEYDDELTDMLDEGNVKDYAEEKLIKQDIIFGDEVKIIKQKQNSKEKNEKKKNKKKRKAVEISTVQVDENEEFDENLMQAWKPYSAIIHGDVLENLQKLRFVNPTPIQAKVLEMLLEKPKMNIVGAAETGSGKTLSFGIPISSIILDALDEEASSERKLRCLIITPTRELAIQVHKHIKAILKGSKARCEALVGGISEEKQKRILQYGPEIIVATPGRYWELFSGGEKHLSDLSQLQFLVLDEADRMLSEGHFPELYNIFNLMNKIRIKLEENGTVPEIQKFVLSATMTLSDLYREVRGKRRTYRDLLSAQQTEQGSEDLMLKLMRILDLQEHEVIDLTPHNRVAHTLLESQVQCLKDEKDVYLYYFALLYKGRTIVFTNSISAVKHLHSMLKLLKIKAYPLHGEMEQKQRLTNLDKFQKYDTAILIATDVAARGLDIPNVKNVIHYQLPRSTEIYVHRCGRAGRAEKEGFSIALVSPKDRYIYMEICKATKKEDGMEEYPISISQVKEIQQRVNLACKIASLTNSFSKQKSTVNWITKYAQDADIELDEAFFPEFRSKSEKGNSKQREVDELQQKLDELLQKKVYINPLTSKSYITSDVRNLQMIDEADSKDLRTDFIAKKAKLK